MSYQGRTTHHSTLYTRPAPDRKAKMTARNRGTGGLLKNLPNRSSGRLDRFGTYFPSSLRATEGSAAAGGNVGEGLVPSRYAVPVRIPRRAYRKGLPYILLVISSYIAWINLASSSLNCALISSKLFRSSTRVVTFICRFFIWSMWFSMALRSAMSL